MFQKKFCPIQVSGFEINWSAGKMRSPRASGRVLNHRQDYWALQKLHNLHDITPTHLVNTLPNIPFVLMPKRNNMNAITDIPMSVNTSVRNKKNLHVVDRASWI